MGGVLPTEFPIILVSYAICILIICTINVATSAWGIFV